uniref:Uncharacterized protein n=1 Tax=Anguilla anguilla TaxID=7936 RepID=A0A0E9RMB2_ANGAN
MLTVKHLGGQIQLQIPASVSYIWCWHR